MTYITNRGLQGDKMGIEKELSIMALNVNARAGYEV